MPLTDENRGTNADGSRSEDYCVYCYKSGEFTQEFTMTQMIEFCLQFFDQWNVQAEYKLTPIQAKEQMLQYFPHLKRWKEKDERTLAEKATHLLSQCENVTIVSIDANGYPRPVQMSKITVERCVVWMATCADSVKVNDFKANNKAGALLRLLWGWRCHAWHGRSGLLMMLSAREMWKDWFIHHFPGGASDPNYVLLHFTGTEATFWINGEYSHSNI